MSVKKPAAIAIGAVLLFSGVAFSKSAWRRVDSGTQSFLRSISAPDSLHVWVTGGGLHRSTDGGLNWSTTSGSGLSGTLLIVRFVDSLHGWVFGYQCCYAARAFRTVDGGQSWTQLNYPPNENVIRAVSFVDTLYGWVVADGDTVYRTTDGGLGWSPHFVGDSSFSATQIQFVDSLRGWVVGGSLTEDVPQIFHSSDGGRNWVLQDLNLADTAGSVIDIDYIDRNRGWVLVGIGAHLRVYRTTDGGNNWSWVYGRADLILESIDFIDSLKGWMTGTEFYGGFVSLIRATADGGRSYTDTLVLEGGSAQKIKMFNENIGWVIDATGGILRYAPITLGDLNWDGELSGADVVLEINRVFLEEPFPAPEQMGDVNCDAQFSAADIVSLVYRVFLQTPFPCEL